VNAFEPRTTLLNLQCDLTCGYGQDASREVFIERQLETPLRVVRAASNLSAFTAAAYVGLLSGDEPLTDGVLDVSSLSPLEGLILPQGRLVASGFYTGFVPPSCCEGQRIRFQLILSCERPSGLQAARPTPTFRRNTEISIESELIEPGRVFEVVISPPHPLMPLYLSAKEDMTGWVICSVDVDGERVLTQPQVFHSTCVSGSLLECWAWKDVSAKGKVVLTLKNDSQKKRAFKAALHGRHLSW
jgi:hypothetical protein